MKFRSAVIAASASAFIASSGLAYAAYTGQLNIIQWGGAVLGAASAIGTSATGLIIGVQGVTGGVAMPVDASGHSLTVTDPSSVNFGSAFPSAGKQIAAAGANGNATPIIMTGGSVPISISTATTTQLIALSTGKSIYITAWDVIAAGAGNITLVYGTGSSCGTGTTALTGAYNLAAQFGIAKGDGMGPVLIVPASNALCAVTSAGTQMSGSVSYSQF